ncbi:MAG: hypothetical protein M3Z35_11165 [Nitrospirota bacterium]|nr:hypothetical protein [Nitrospirota bacterium]
MKPLVIRTFTSRGLAEFAAYLGSGPISSEPPPGALLEDDFYARPYDDIAEIRVRRFATKYELGMEISTSFGGEEKTDAALKENALWAWLSLACHESTMPKRDGTNWFLGAKSRHVVELIPGRHQDQSHRHLVKGAAMAVRRFGRDAKVLLGRPDEQSKIEEQIMSRKADMGLASAKEVVRAAFLLYFDAERDIVKRGAKSTGAGSIMRFVEVLTQLDVNFDIPSLKAETILSLLPPQEFGKFIETPASIN